MRFCVAARGDLAGDRGEDGNDRRALNPNAPADEESAVATEPATRIHERTARLRREPRELEERNRTEQRVETADRPRGEKQQRRAETRCDLARSAQDPEPNRAPDDGRDGEVRAEKCEQGSATRHRSKATSVSAQRSAASRNQMCDRVFRSPLPVRSLIANGERGQIFANWEETNDESYRTTLASLACAAAATSRRCVTHPDEPLAPSSILP
jgi:hypothetical protein